MNLAPRQFLNLVIALGRELRNQGHESVAAKIEASLEDALYWDQGVLRIRETLVPLLPALTGATRELASRAVRYAEELHPLARGDSVYDRVEKLAKELSSLGDSERAAALVDALRNGSTSGEIMPALVPVLRDVISSRPRRGSAVRFDLIREAKICLKEILAALATLKE